MLVIGVDLKKDKAVLDAAYDDAQGVTAAFNLNLLARINRELGGDFQLPALPAQGVLRRAPAGGSRCTSRACPPARPRRRRSASSSRPGETIHTEISCKYTIEEFRRLAAGARFHAEAVWTDPENLFAVHAMMAV